MPTYQANYEINADIFDGGTFMPDCQPHYRSQRFEADTEEGARKMAEEYKTRVGKDLFSPRPVLKSLMEVKDVSLEKKVEGSKTNPLSDLASPPGMISAGKEVLGRYVEKNLEGIQSKEIGAGENPFLPKTYTAVFRINHGVSTGYGMKYDDVIEEIKKISAINDITALVDAEDIAEKFSRDYMSDNSGFTTVTLESLNDSNIDELNQEKIMRAYAKTLDTDDAAIDAYIAKLMPEGKLVVKCSMLEHALELLQNSK